MFLPVFDQGAEGAIGEQPLVPALGGLCKTACSKQDERGRRQQGQEDANKAQA